MRYRDFEEFLASCNAHGVGYLVVGAHAVAFHSHPRATKDLDIYVEASAENAERLLAAIHDFFGGADLGFTVDDVINHDTKAPGVTRTALTSRISKGRDRHAESLNR